MVLQITVIEIVQILELQKKYIIEESKHGFLTGLFVIYNLPKNVCVIRNNKNSTS